MDNKWAGRKRRRALEDCIRLKTKGGHVDPMDWECVDIPEHGVSAERIKIHYSYIKMGGTQVMENDERVSYVHLQIAMKTQLMAHGNVRMSGSVWINYKHILEGWGKSIDEVKQVFLNALTVTVEQMPIWSLWWYDCYYMIKPIEVRPGESIFNEYRSNVKVRLGDKMVPVNHHWVKKVFENVRQTIDALCLNCKEALKESDLDTLMLKLRNLLNDMAYVSICMFLRLHSLEQIPSFAPSHYMVDMVKSML